MSNKDFDFNKVFDTVRTTIHPEYAVPKDKELHPVNFRTGRVKMLITEITSKQAALASEITKLNTQLSALLETIQPYLEEEMKVSEEEAKAAEAEDSAKDKAEDKAEDAKEDDK